MTCFHWQIYNAGNVVHVYGSLNASRNYSISARHVSTAPLNQAVQFCK